MSDLPKKIEQNEKYPDEICSFILGNCYDKKTTVGIVKQYNSYDALLAACELAILDIAEASVKFERGHHKVGQQWLVKALQRIEAAIAEAEVK